MKQTIYVVFKETVKSLFNLFKKTEKTEETKCPSFGEVFTTITDKELHDAFIAYEVFFYAPSAENIAYKNGVKTLRRIAAAHNWDYEIFLDIIDEEYSIFYDK